VGDLKKSRKSLFIIPIGGSCRFAPQFGICDAKLQENLRELRNEYV
jgi:hypothetical protein